MRGILALVARCTRERKVLQSATGMNKEGQELWLPSAAARITLFLFFFSLLVMSLFLLGNFQSFLDSTQTMLLAVFEGASLLYVVAALYWVIVQIVLAIRGVARLNAVSLVLSILGIGFLLGAHLVFGFLIVWLEPVN